MTVKSLVSVIAIAALAGCAGAEEEKPEDAAKSTASVTDAAPKAEPSEETKLEAKPTKTSTELTCTEPVKASDTAKTLMGRYGDDAKLETLSGPEGMEIPGVVLWDGDDKRVVEVGFEDEARTKISFARVGDKTSWTLSSLSSGDTLANVQKVNGKPLKFYGFEWDYSGMVFDWGGGKLDMLSGGCVAQMDFTYDWDNYEMPDSMVGDSEVSSDASDVDQKAVSIAGFGVGFPLAE